MTSRSEDMDSKNDGRFEWKLEMPPRNGRPNPRLCETCRFWQPNPDAGTERVMGQCCFSAESREWRYGTDWCGDHEPVEEPK